jgi:hypothetical protein
MLLNHFLNIWPPSLRVLPCSRTPPTWCVTSTPFMVEEPDLSCTPAVRARERLTELALRHEPTAGGVVPDGLLRPKWRARLLRRPPTIRGIFPGTRSRAPRRAPGRESPKVSRRQEGRTKARSAPLAAKDPRLETFNYFQTVSKWKFSPVRREGFKEMIHLPQRCFTPACYYACMRNGAGVSHLSCLASLENGIRLTRAALLLATIALAMLSCSVVTSGPPTAPPWRL